MGCVRLRWPSFPLLLTPKHKRGDAGPSAPTCASRTCLGRQSARRSVLPEAPGSPGEGGCDSV